MSKTLGTVRGHVESGRIRVSQHGLQELSDDAISLVAVVQGIADAIIVEDYPDYAKGPCVLCFQRDELGKPIHVLWGLAANGPDVATIITAYRPDPNRWMDDLMTRKPR
ncbi:MAG: DUF4258 domain-containing protein [Hyphomicrobiaceae bacterium]